MEPRTCLAGYAAHGTVGYSRTLSSLDILSIYYTALIGEVSTKKAPRQLASGLCILYACALSY